MFFQSLKNIFIVILLSLITAKSVYADIINKITISGNERVNTETIKMFGGIKVGENLNSNDLNKILKNLYETNFFENVNISINESILLINVTENPIIQNLIINGIENKSLKKKIVENILLKEKNPFVESDIKVELQKLK